MAAPTSIPAFDPLRDAVLEALGWTWQADVEVYTHAPIGGREFPVLDSARLRARSAPAEVVFGTLHRFGVPFAPLVERLLLEPRPPFNAVHVAAAGVLAAGGPVWTPNIDVAIEDAYSSSVGADVPRVVVGARTAAGERQAFHAEDVRGGVLFKLHGSADSSESLAFTDLELLAPYSAEEIEHLAGLARGRRLVFYGYRGADTDLRTLIDGCIASAAEVVWYEPDPRAREHIQRTYGSLVRFDPDELPGLTPSDWPTNLAATADAFVIEANRAGVYNGSADLRAKLGSLVDRRPISLRFDQQPPAIVNARLVERFGKAADIKTALKAARREDLRPRAVRAHLHWIQSASLYSRGGLVGRMVGFAAEHPTAAARLPVRFRSYVFDKGPAMLLPKGLYRQVFRLTERALNLPERSAPLRRGSDLYYRAHSFRYLNRPNAARDDLAEAAVLLGNRHQQADVERYAGVLLEQGIGAIMQAAPGQALARADDLVNGPGRYAIGRWSAWGHWLAGMAHLYSIALNPDLSQSHVAVDAAVAELGMAETDFDESDLNDGLGDVYIGRLLLHRLNIALGRAPHEMPSAPTVLSQRQLQDQHLLQADLALAGNDLDAADQHLDAVDRLSPSELTKSLVRFARAEVAHRRNKNAEPTLLEIKAEAEQVGAHFLAAQAALTLSQGPVSTLGGQRVRAVGEPRVLWLLT